MAPQVPASELLNPSRELPLAAGAGQDLTFVFNYDQLEYVPIVQAFYPGGDLSAIASSPDHNGAVYRVPAGETTSSLNLPPGSGLAVTVSDATTTHRIDLFVGSSHLGGTSKGAWDAPAVERDPDFVPLAGAASPVRHIAWEGEVYAEGGRYLMELRTDAHALLAIDGKIFLNLCDNAPSPNGVHLPGGLPWKSAEVSLAPGWHPVRLDLEPTGDANGLEWAWVRPNGVREIVPPGRLRYAASGQSAGAVHFPEVSGQNSCSP
jgi:hypothetical protein